MLQAPVTHWSGSVNSPVVQSPIDAPPIGDCGEAESATVDFINTKAESLQAFFRPEGASTNQPRAERSRVAPPWESKP